MKLIISSFILLALSCAGLFFLGYRVHPENFSYYKPEPGPTSSKVSFGDYVENFKHQNKIRPLISRDKKGSAAAGMKKSSEGLLNQLTQADKMQQLDKTKAQLSGIQAEAAARDKLIEDLGKS